MLKHFLVPEADQVLVAEATAREGTQALFEKMGMPAEDAALCADVLIMSDLRGCESHGISNMVRRYLEMYPAGILNPTPNVKTIRESAVSATLDADRGIGLQVGPRAMQIAMDKAEEYGMGAVGVQNCGHVGMLAYYPLMAIERDMIGVCMVSAGGGIMVPTFGSEPVFGTHPIAWAAPASTMPPFVFDVATTQVAANKLGLAYRIGSKLEPGWICDLGGAPIMDAVDTPEYGDYYMLPFGGTRENGSHKGFGFAAVADIMSGMLSGNGPRLSGRRRQDVAVRDGLQDRRLHGSGAIQGRHGRTAEEAQRHEAGARPRARLLRRAHRARRSRAAPRKRHPLSQRSSGLVQRDSGEARTQPALALRAGRAGR